MTTYTYTGANISVDSLYRYRLVRSWSHGRTATCFIMLNPSTADHATDDPTIRRCVRFATSWGHTRLIVVNLFAWRSTDPRQMVKASDPVGIDNDRYILEAVREAYVVVAAWGVLPKKLAPRGDQVRRLLKEAGQNLYVLGLTQDGFPRHPLYVPGNVVLSKWEAA